MIAEALTKFLFGGAAEQVGEYFKKKQELKHELKIAKMEGAIKRQRAKDEAKAAAAAHVNSWELAQIANSGKKDEVVLAVVLLPYVGVFIPVVQDYVLQGFENLAKMPVWAIGLTVLIFLAVFGIRHTNANRLQAPGISDEDVRTRNATES